MYLVSYNIFKQQKNIYTVCAYTLMLTHVYSFLHSSIKTHSISTEAIPGLFLTTYIHQLQRSLTVSNLAETFYSGTCIVSWSSGFATFIHIETGKKRQDLYRPVAERTA